MGLFKKGDEEIEDADALAVAAHQPGSLDHMFSVKLGQDVQIAPDT